MTMMEEVEVSQGISEEDRPLTAVEKALAVLGAFEGAATQIGVSEVARRARLPKSTAYRLLMCLEAQGYVERQDVRYCLGRRLFELGNQVLWCRPRNLRDTALPFMCDLYGLTRKTIHLAVLDGRDVLYIEKLQGHDGRTVPTRVGGRVNARATALGKAMLAFGSQTHVDSVLKDAPLQRTPYSIVSKRLFLEELEQVRRQGFAIDREEVLLGLTCVAAPIVSRGRLLGALSVSGATHDFDPLGLANRIRTTAAVIGNGMG